MPRAGERVAVRKTGQDSYLNKSDQVYKDSVAYQHLFGGEAMLTLVTMDKGHAVNELFTPADERNWVSRGLIPHDLLDLTIEHAPPSPEPELVPAIPVLPRL
jgi:hypothetical protein